MNAAILTCLLLSGTLSISCSELLTRHKRAWIIDTFSIVEEHPGPFPYELGCINIAREYRVLFELHGNGVDEEPKGILNIDAESGVLMVHKKIDYEEYQVLRLTFQARNTSNHAIDTKLGMEINILDINDHAPLFQQNLYEATIHEAKAQGTFIITVLAYDEDKTGTPNSTFDYRIQSVTPSPPNAEFFVRSNGAVSFTGCLDYEVAEKYTILVEAKDHGISVSQSSSTTVLVHVLDSNNHLPTITGHTGTARVSEREAGVSPVRIHVTDKDTRNTEAWRAKYTIQGDAEGSFKIETDPETNDGILTVVKPLNFEEGAERKLTITVENEEPYFSCEVKERSSSGLWTVVAGSAPALSSETVTITVEDTNEPPVFLISVKDVLVVENVKIGHPVERITAIDPDTGLSDGIVYAIGNDPGDWVTVDPTTGQIDTVKTLDRESIYVVDNTYTVIIWATDEGDPPLTGTGTLRIHLTDQNDNLPQLVENTLSMCLLDGASVANITAYDLDKDPYGGPFTFELLGDVQGRWSIDPRYGSTVKLVKENVVYSGLHTLVLRLWDMQGQFTLHNLTVTVCECSTTTLSCLQRRATETQVGAGMVVTILVALILLLVFLLLAFVISCGTEKPVIQINHESEDALLPSNIETPGTDCQVPNITTAQYLDNVQTKASGRGFQQIKTSQQILNQTLCQNMDFYVCGERDVTMQSGMDGFYLDQNGFYQNVTMQSQNQNGFYQNVTMQSQNQNGFHQGSMSSMKHLMHRDVSSHMEASLHSLLSLRLSSIQAPGEELYDYDPCLYAYEEDSVTDPDLEPIPIPEKGFDLDNLQDLGPRFKQLAAVCMPSTQQ